MYRLMDAAVPITKKTQGFQSYTQSYNNNTKFIQFWDVSGDEAERAFWRTLYTNVAFNDVIYVIDPSEFRLSPQKIQEDRQEIQALLCEPELADAQFLLYFNWKKDKERDNSQVNDQEKHKTEMQILADLELHGFQNYVKEIVDFKPVISQSASAEEIERQARMEKNFDATFTQKMQKFNEMAESKNGDSKGGDEKDKKQEEDKKNNQKSSSSSSSSKKNLAKVPKRFLEKDNRNVFLPINNEEQLFSQLDLEANNTGEKAKTDDDYSDVLA